MPSEEIELLEKITRLQREAESLRRQEQRDELQLEEVWRKLKEEHGCKSLEKVQENIEKLRKKESQLSSQLDKEMGEYQRKYGSK